MSVPTLVCIAGPRKGQSFEITEQGLRLGRDASNDIVLDDPAVSRFHGRVILHNHGVWVQDAGSRNGVFVNEARVAANKQVKPGDRVTIGESAFDIEMVEQDAERSVSVDLGAVQALEIPRQPMDPPTKKWKIWPFALAFVLILLLILIVSLLGKKPADGSASNAKPSSYSLAAALENPTPDAPEKAKPAIGLESALTAAASRANNVPDPPPGVTAAELVDQGHEHYRSGRLRDALVAYQMALKVDPTCEICNLRIERLHVEIDAAIQESFDAGLRYYESLQYQQAINAWEKVLLLDPDESSPNHIRTNDYLEKAKARLGSP